MALRLTPGLSNQISSTSKALVDTINSLPRTTTPSTTSTRTGTVPTGTSSRTTTATPVVNRTSRTAPAPAAAPAVTAPPTYSFTPTNQETAFQEPSWLSEFQSWVAQQQGTNDAAAATAKSSTSARTTETDTSSEAASATDADTLAAAKAAAWDSYITGQQYAQSQLGKGSGWLSNLWDGITSAVGAGGDNDALPFSVYKGDWSDQSVLDWYNQEGRAWQFEKEQYAEFADSRYPEALQAHVSNVNDLLGTRDTVERWRERTGQHYNELKDQNAQAFQEALAKGEEAFQGLEGGIDDKVAQVEGLANTAWAAAGQQYADVAAHTAQITAQFNQTLEEIRQRTTEAYQWLDDREALTLSEFRNDTAALVEAAVPQARAMYKEQMQTALEGLQRAGLALDSPQSIATVTQVSTNAREKIGQLVTSTWSDYNRTRTDLRTKYAELGTTLRNTFTGAFSSVVSAGLGAMGQAGYNLASAGRNLSEAGTTLTNIMSDTYKWGEENKSNLAQGYANFQATMEELRLKGNDQVADAFNLMMAADQFVPEYDYMMAPYAVENAMEDRSWSRFMDIMGLVFQLPDFFRGIFGDGGCGGGGGGSSSGTELGSAAITGGTGVAGSLGGAAIIAGALSDVGLKTDFRESPEGILDRLCRMPVTEWRYRWEPEGTRHIGPMAQDFWSTFRLGNSNRVIGIVDGLGILMKAVQELAGEVRALKTRLGGT